jgi:S-DNA-T family DNA segregation ATPase FtsK/SpoIIIE
VKFCAAHAKQNFVQGVTTEMNNAEGGGGSEDGGGRLGGNGMSDEDAELYTRCVQLVITERKASTSLLQRRFSIGYGRAAKIMDMMEKRGVIGPASGNTSRPREVLIEAP